MKKIIYVILAGFLSCVVLSCSDWTEYSPNKIDHKEVSEEYYADLREWKSNYKDRSISFGWFGGWTGKGASLVNSLGGLPDSMDMVSIWGDWKTVSPEQRKDLEFVQQVKGLKVLACSFTMNVGDGYTPEGKTVLEYWGWDPSASGINQEPTEEQATAIRKYAKAIADTIITLGYDGFDIDHEPNYGGNGDLASSYPRLKVFIEELGKYFGPESGTGKILTLDGEPQSIPASVGQHFDWFIVQAYDSPGYTDLNARLRRTIDNHKGGLTPEEVANRYVVTENFEKAAYYTTGGRDFKQEDGTTVKSYAGMAGWVPSYDGKRYRKGGAGVYHIEYEYSVPGQDGFYPFTYNAIRIMNSMK